jgi:predicted amidophosphoribosyltransferase
MSWQRSTASGADAAQDLYASNLHEAGLGPGTDGLVAPRSGPGVCRICFNLIGSASRVCRACLVSEHHLDVVVPISYSVNGSVLHTEIVAYKRHAEPFVAYAIRDLAAILERFLVVHELCLGAGKPFDLVTTVPSSDRRRDRHNQLRRVVAELVPTVGVRHRRVLAPLGVPVERRAFNPGRYQALEPLRGQRVLLIDDMWTTGASAQSAAAVLRAAGASYVAAAIIGRHLNVEYADNRHRLELLSRGFSWGNCVVCRPPT